jgi:hypothetical protein
MEFKATLIRWPLRHKSDDWRETAFKWLVSINGQEFDYYTGQGHVVFKTKGKYWLEAHYGIADSTRLLDISEWLQYVNPREPSLDDVLYSLVMDASACESSFDDWCSDFGYDTDSRKALETYLLCQENTTKLRKAGVNMTKERERLEDY